MPDNEKIPALDLSNYGKSAPKEGDIPALDLSNYSVKKKDISESPTPSSQSGGGVSEVPDEVTQEQLNSVQPSKPVPLGQQYTEKIDIPTPVKPKFDTKIKGIPDQFKLDPAELPLQQKKDLAHRYAAEGKVDVSEQILNTLPDTDSYKHELSANNLWQKGDKAGARAKYLEAIKTNPNNPRLYLSLAELSAGMQDESNTIGYADKYLKMVDGEKGFDVAQGRAKAYQLLGDEKKAKYWQMTANDIAKDISQNQYAETIKGFPDKVYENLKIMYAPTELLIEGGKKIYQGLKALDPYDVQSESDNLDATDAPARLGAGVIDVAFGAMMSTPAGTAFNAALMGGNLVGASQITDWAFAPVSKILEKGGVDETKFNEWGKFGVQTGNVLISLLFLHGAKAGSKKVVEIAEKLQRKEPLNADEVKVVDEVVASESKEPTATPEVVAKIDETIAEQKTADELKKFQDETTEPTYRVNSELVKTPDEVVEKVNELQDKGVSPENIEVDIRNDAPGQQKVAEEVANTPKVELRQSEIKGLNNQVLNGLDQNNRSAIHKINQALKPDNVLEFVGTEQTEGGATKITGITDKGKARIEKVNENSIQLNFRNKSTGIIDSEVLHFKSEEALNSAVDLIEGKFNEKYNTEPKSEVAKEEPVFTETRTGEKSEQPGKDITTMSSTEIDEYAKEVKQKEAELDVKIFGEQGAKEYKQAQRVLNSDFSTPEQRNKASETIDKLEKSLTQEQYDEYFNTPLAEPSELRDIARKVRYIEEAENINELSTSIKNATLRMNGDNPSPETLAILNAAKKRAAELNIPVDDLIKSVLKKVGGEYKDLNDAEFMMKSVLGSLVKGTEAPKSDVKAIPDQPRTELTESAPEKVEETRDERKRRIEKETLDRKKTNENLGIKVGTNIKHIETGDVSTVYEIRDNGYLLIEGDRVGIVDIMEESKEFEVTTDKPKPPTKKLTEKDSSEITIDDVKDVWWKDKSTPEQLTVGDLVHDKGGNIGKIIKKTKKNVTIENIDTKEKQVLSDKIYKLPKNTEARIREELNKRKNQVVESEVSPKPKTNEVKEEGRQEGLQEVAPTASEKAGEQSPTVSKGAEISPNKEVKTDLETVAEELKLEPYEVDIYNALKDLPKEKHEEELADNLLEKKRKELEKTERELNDAQTDLDLAYESVDEVKADTELSKSEKDSKLKKLEAEIAELEPKVNSLKEKVSNEEKAIDKIEDYDIEIDGAEQLINRVNARLETRKAVKAGTDLFPEMANIPEFNAKIKKIKETDNSITDEAIRRIADKDVKELEQSAKDIERKSLSTKADEVAEAVEEADRIIAEVKGKIKDIEEKIAPSKTMSRTEFVEAHYKSVVEDMKKRGNWWGFERDNTIKNYQKDLKSAKKNEPFDNFLFEEVYQNGYIGEQARLNVLKDKISETESEKAKPTPKPVEQPAGAPKPETVQNVPSGEKAEISPEKTKAEPTKRDAAKEKLQKGVDGLANKWGAKKNILPEEKTEFIQDLKNIVEGVTELTVEEIKDFIREQIKPFIAHLKLTPKDVDDIISKVTGEDINTIRHADTKKIREEAGLPEYEKTRIANAETVAEAQKQIKDGYNVQELYDKVETGSPVSAVEQAILAETVLSLRKKVNEELTDANIAELEKALDVSDMAGSEAGRSLQMRKQQYDPEASVADMIIQNKKTVGVDKLTEAQKEVNKKEWEEIDSLKKQLAEKEKELENERKRKKAEEELNKVLRSTKVRRKGEELKKEREDLFAALKKARQDSNVQLSGFGFTLAEEKILAKIVKNYVESGVNKLDQLVSEIYEGIKDDFEGVTKEDILGIVAGETSHPKEKKTRSELAKQLQDLKAEAKEIKTLDDLINGKQPSGEKSKIKRNRQISDTKKRINELRRQMGLGQFSEEAKLEAYKNRMQGEIKRIEEELKSTKPIETKRPEPIKLDKEGLEIKDKLIAARQRRQARIIREKYAAQSSWTKIGGHAIDILTGTSRGLMATADLSMMFLQNGVIAMTHPVYWGKAVAPALRDLFSEKSYQRWMADVQADPRFHISKEAKLDLSDPKSPELTAAEELYRSNLVDKIPFLGKPIKVGKYNVGGITQASSRVFSSFSNRIRVNMFYDLIDQWQAQGKTIQNNPKLYKSTARLINAATGRASFGTFQKDMRIIANTLWSPRMYLSQLEMLTAPVNPYYWRSPNEVKFQIAKDMAKFVGTSVSLLALAKLAGAEVEDDPRSKDFGKIKIGDTRIGLPGGLTQWIILATQLGTGEVKSTVTGKIKESGTGFTDINRLQIAGRFLRGKTAPTISLAIDVTSGQTYMGEDVTLAKEAGQYLVPLSISTAVKTAQNEGLEKAIPIGIGASTGLPIQSYPKTGWYKNQSYSAGGKTTNALGEDPKKPDNEAWKLMEKYKVDVSPPNKSRLKGWDDEKREDYTYSKEQYVDFIAERGKFIKEEVKKLDEKLKENHRKYDKPKKEVYIDYLFEDTKYADGERVFKNREIAAKCYDEVLIPGFISDIVRDANEEGRAAVEKTIRPSREEIDIYKYVTRFQNKMSGK